MLRVPHIYTALDRKARIYKRNISVDAAVCLM
jgi:hypothetical protein